MKFNCLIQVIGFFLIIYFKSVSTSSYPNQLSINQNVNTNFNNNVSTKKKSFFETFKNGYSSVIPNKLRQISIMNMLTGKRKNRKPTEDHNLISNADLISNPTAFTSHYSEKFAPQFLSIYNDLDKSYAKNQQHILRNQLNLNSGINLPLTDKINNNLNIKANHLVNNNLNGQQSNKNLFLSSEKNQKNKLIGLTASASTSPYAASLSFQPSYYPLKSNINYNYPNHHIFPTRNNGFQETYNNGLNLITAGNQYSFDRQKPFLNQNNYQQSFNQFSIQPNQIKNKTPKRKCGKCGPGRRPKKHFQSFDNQFNLVNNNLRQKQHYNELQNNKNFAKQNSISYKPIPDEKGEQIKVGSDIITIEDIEQALNQNNLHQITSKDSQIYEQLHNLLVNNVSPLTSSFELNNQNSPYTNNFNTNNQNYKTTYELNSYNDDLSSRPLIKGKVLNEDQQYYTSNNGWKPKISNDYSFNDDYKQNIQQKENDWKSVDFNYKPVFDEPQQKIMEQQVKVNDDEDFSQIDQQKEIKPISQKKTDIMSPMQKALAKSTEMPIVETTTTIPTTTAKTVTEMPVQEEKKPETKKPKRKSKKPKEEKKIKKVVKKIESKTVAAPFDEQITNQDLSKEIEEATTTESALEFMDKTTISNVVENKFNTERFTFDDTTTYASVEEKQVDDVSQNEENEQSFTTQRNVIKTTTENIVRKKQRKFKTKTQEKKKKVMELATTTMSSTTEDSAMESTTDFFIEQNDEKQQKNTYFNENINDNNSKKFNLIMNKERKDVIFEDFSPFEQDIDIPKQSNQQKSIKNNKVKKNRKSPTTNNRNALTSIGTDFGDFTATFSTEEDTDKKKKKKKINTQNAEESMENMHYRIDDVDADDYDTMNSEFMQDDGGFENDFSNENPEFAETRNQVKKLSVLNTQNNNQTNTTKKVKSANKNKVKVNKKNVNSPKQNSSRNDQDENETDVNETISDLVTKIHQANGGDLNIINEYRNYFTPEEFDLLTDLLKKESKKNSKNSTFDVINLKTSTYKPKLNSFITSLDKELNAAESTINKKIINSLYTNYNESKIPLNSSLKNGAENKFDYHSNKNKPKGIDILLNIQENKNPIPGKPGKDYPTLINLPIKTNFTCLNKNSGFYTDYETGCQAYHSCNNNKQQTFLCANGTLFDQNSLVCSWWYLVDCKPLNLQLISGLKEENQKINVSSLLKSN